MLGDGVGDVALSHRLRQRRSPDDDNDNNADDGNAVRRDKSNDDNADNGNVRHHNKHGNNDNDADRTGGNVLSAYGHRKGDL